MGWAIMANRLRLIIQFSPLEKKLFLWELINRRQIYLKSFLLKMKMPNDRHQGCRRCQWWAFQENTHKHRCVKRKSFGSWTWASRQLYSTNQMPCSKYITLVIDQLTRTSPQLCPEEGSGARQLLLSCRLCRMMYQGSLDYWFSFTCYLTSVPTSLMLSPPATHLCLNLYRID